MTTADATKRANSYVDGMSPEQKIDYIGGTGFAVRAVPEMSDGPFGARKQRAVPIANVRDVYRPRGIHLHAGTPGWRRLRKFSKSHVFIAGLPKLDKPLRSARCVQKEYNCGIH